MCTRMMVELTEDQRQLLKPMFDRALAHNKHGYTCAIGAQVFPDGIHVKFFSGDQADALAIALGGNPKQEISLARDAYDQGVKADRG